MDDPNTVGENSNFPQHWPCQKIHNSFTLQRGYEALAEELNDLETFNGIIKWLIDNIFFH